MNMILNWFKSLKNNHQSQIDDREKIIIDVKRQNCTINFIFPGHPLYDNIIAQEKNQLRILAPNETAYDEKSLIHNFAAIVTVENDNYLVVNSAKHFKEQSIGGLLQYDENIYNVIPFFEDETEYQTANAYSFSESYEYDHPIQLYSFTAEHNEDIIGIELNKGKEPINVNMIDNNRQLFRSKLNDEYINLIDYAVIPALNAYNQIQEKKRNKAS